MNRSILIVICDFLVSAMLSMMTGMVPAHTGGTGVGLDANTTRLLLSELENHRRELERTRARLREAAARLGETPEREAELKRLAEEIAANLRKSAALEEQLKRTPENTGALTPEELQRRLEAEIEKRLMTEIAVRDREEDLASARDSLTETRQELKDSRRSLDEMRESLTRAGDNVVRLADENRAIRAELSSAEVKLTETAGELKQTQETVAARDAELAGAKEALKELNERFGQVNLESKALQNSLAFTTGKLTQAERESADYRDQLARLTRQFNASELARREAVRRNEEMQQLVKRSVNELTQTRSELEETTGELEKTRKELAADRETAITATAKLSAVESKLADAERKLRNDVLESYSSSAVRLDVGISEERMMFSQRGGGEYFLPLVEFNGKSYLVGSFSTLIGELDVPMTFNRVSELSYTVSPPAAEVKFAPIRLAGPLLALGKDSRVAAFEVTVPGRTPLKTLSIEELKKRGVQNLYLFKTSSFGRDSAELTGRCSVDFSAAAPYLFIRNQARGAGSELRAEPGDLVLTREGEFVGVVVANEAVGLMRSNEAKVLLFDPGEVWSKATAVSIAREPGREYFDAFTTGVRGLKARQIEQK